MEMKASTRSATIKSFLENFPIRNSFQREEKGTYKITFQSLARLRKVQRFLGSETAIKATPGEANRLQKEGIKVLKRGKIEDYLLSDDVLQALCRSNRLETCEEKVTELVELRDNTRISRVLLIKFVEGLLTGECAKQVRLAMGSCAIH